MSIDNTWINLRRLAAVDIASLGPKLIIAEFAGGVFVCGSLGIFVLLQGGSTIRLVFGLYLIALAINYVPMLLHAIATARNNIARIHVIDELNITRQMVARYRRESLLLLVPLLVPILALSPKKAEYWRTKL
jgi:hypothetical protein